jgi:hypothetical protein
MARIFITKPLALAAILAICGCVKPTASGTDAGEHRLGASIPVGPGTFNNLPITFPNITAPLCDAGLIWANGGPGTDGGCVTNLSGGVNQLTGQVTAGPGSGAQAATVVIPQANQFYVAVGASDSNPCNLANPCATYAHAASLAVTAGATATNLYAVNFGPGHFSENVTFVSGVGVSGTVGFDTAVTVFTGSTFGLGSSFTGAALAGSFLNGVSFVPSGSFAFDLNFVGLSSTDSFFDIVNTTLAGTLTVEGYSGTSIAIYNSYNVSFNIQNAGTFSSWSNIMILPITTQCNSTVCGWTSQNDAITGSGSVLLEGSQTNTTVFANVGFRAGLTLNGTASTFAGDIGSIPTGGVTYSGGATSAQYSISGLLPISNITPSDGGSILVLTSDGGTVYWSSPVVDGGGGITQLTGPVTAGPGSGTVASAINFGGGSLSGKLPIANLAACTAGQILESNATPTQTCTSVTGDVTLSNTGGTTVTALQGNAVASGALTKGDALFATSTSTWAEAAFGGDLTCSTVTPGSCTLGSIDGKSLPSPPGTGTTVLTDTTGTLSWASGSGTSVTGTGIWYSASGALNSAAVQCSGDTTCTAALSGGNLPITVTQIHGASVPIAGSLTIGNVLQVSGSSTTLAYAPVNLAGGGNFVTGNLPVGNVAPGTSAQVLMSNATPATTWTTLTGDTTISATGVTTTGKVNGISITGTPAVGNVPIATSTTAASWSELTSSDFTPGTAAQFLMTNGTPATAWQSLSGDVGAFSTGQIVVDSAQSGEIAFSSGGSETWVSSATPLLTQSSVSTATGANFTIQPQVSTNTNGTSGGVTMTFGAPTGTGSEAQFQIARAGTGTILWEGPLPGNAGWGGISFVAPNSTGSNVAMFGAGGTTFLNSTVQIDLDIGAAGPFALVTSSGMEVAHNSADFGSGVGVLGLGVASTVPTTVPSTNGDAVLYSIASTGLFVDLASTGFVTQELAPIFTGTENTQAREFLMDGAFCRSTSTTPVTCLTIPVSSGLCALVVIRASARISSGGSIGQTILTSTSACNNAGTLSSSGFTNFGGASFGSSTASLSGTVSGGNLLIQVSDSSGTNTYDWSIFATLDYN